MTGVAVALEDGRHAVAVVAPVRPSDPGGSRVFPRDVAAAGAAGGRSVDLGVDVVLAGLPPVYAHGLHAGLTATGLRCTVARAATAGDLSGEPGRALVVVQPSGADPATDGPPRAQVRVLADGSAQAYSDALQAGATGAFPPDAELGDIVRVLLCAGLGLTLLPVDVARGLSRPSTGPGPQLTSRELQYLRLLAGGATVASLSRQFAHSERDMYRLLSGVYQRLGARNRTDALLLAQRFGLLDEGT